MSNPFEYETHLAHEQEAVPNLINMLSECSLEAIDAHMAETVPVLEEHFAEEEGPGGFYDAIRSEAPRFAGKVNELTREHGEVLASVRELIALAARYSTARDEALAARDALVETLRAHNQAEIHLLQEAYQVDLGGE